MPSSEQMREAVKNAYLSPNWHDRVNGMSNTQVAAIYKRLLGQGKIK